MEIKAGDQCKILLLASRTLKADRMSRGVNEDSYVGTALNDLKLGERFIMDTKKGELKTSPVEKITENMFMTKNSTYQIEKVESNG